MTPSESSMKKYDGLYIFVGTAKDDVLDQQIDKVCGEITRLDGNVLTTEVLGKRTFARPMQKLTTAPARSLVRSACQCSSAVTGLPGRSRYRSCRGRSSGAFWSGGIEERKSVRPRVPQPKRRLPKMRTTKTRTSSGTTSKSDWILE